MRTKNPRLTRRNRTGNGASKKETKKAEGNKKAKQRKGRSTKRKKELTPPHDGGEPDLPQIGKTYKKKGKRTQHREEKN